MFKRIILSIIILNQLSSFAQTILVGPEIGLNLIQVDNQKYGREFQLGMYGGGAVEYRLNKSFAIKTGVYLSQTRQGYDTYDTTAFDFFGLADSSFTVPGIDLNTYSKTTNRQSQLYIQIPIMANYKWNGVNLYAGGYLGFMIAAKRKEGIVSTTPFMSTINLDSIDPSGFISGFFPKAFEESFQETSDKTNLRVLDYGLKAGIGYEFDKLAVNCFFNYGIPDFRKDRGNSKLQNHAYFQISACYLLELNKGKAKSSLN